MANVILFSDGGCKPNPGYAGFGVFGYTYVYSDRPANIKHPAYTDLYFNDKGVDKVKPDKPIKVENIIEYIGAIQGTNSTNNQAELFGVLKALELAESLCGEGDNLDIYTDSSYIVSAYNENLDRWIQNNWTRLDGKALTHRKEWEIILLYRKLYLDKKVNLTINWIKGHDGAHGNHMSDVFSTIGANASRILNGEQDTCIYSSVINYKDYKNSYLDKDFIYTFKNLYFSTNELVDDKNYCFLHSGEDEEIGKKSLSSIFAVNIGYIPECINKVKSFYRSLRSNYTSMCCLKLSKFKDKDLLRLFNYVDPKYILMETSTRNSGKSFALVRDTTNFITEIDSSFPFIMNANKLFNKLIDLRQNWETGYVNTVVEDITDRVMSSDKVKLTTKDKHINVTDIVSKYYRTPHVVTVKIGNDICGYLGLKNIENTITDILIALEPSESMGYLTIYTIIRTKDREVYICNIDNKYLVFPKV